MKLSVTILVILAVWLAVNFATYRMFAMDKRFAERRQWRVPEASLLMFALIGGSAGAKLAQQLKRHKTRKQPFASILNLIVLGHISLLAALTYFGLWGVFIETASDVLELLFVSDSNTSIQPKRFGPGS